MSTETSSHALFANDEMDSLDGDLFALSDDDVVPARKIRNPIQEHLQRQLADVNERIEKTKGDIQEMRDVTDRILKTLHRRATCENIDEDSADSSDDDSDLYKISGEPLAKKKKHRSYERTRTLVLKGYWQRVFDDKWVIGAELQNVSSQHLVDLAFYGTTTTTTTDGVVPTSGTSTFWRPIDETLWCRTSRLDPRAERIVATLVLDVPVFDRVDVHRVNATIVYDVLDGPGSRQLPLPTIRLTHRDVADGRCRLEFRDESETCAIALKSVYVERTATIRLDEEAGSGARLLEFLRARDFREVHADVYLARDVGSVGIALVEILPIEEDVATFRIYARSAAQMSILLRLLREELPELRTREESERDRVKCGAIALAREIEMYLAGATEPQLQIARAKTDLLIP